MAQVKLTVGSLAQGRQYATIAAAYAAIPANLVAAGDSYLLELYNDGVFDLGSSSLVLDARTTDALHNITIRPAPGHAFFENLNPSSDPYALNPAKGVTLRGTGNYYKVVNVQADYTVLYGLQFDHAGGGNSGTGVAIDASAPNAVIDLCIVQVKPSGSYITGVGSGDGKFTISNTLIILNAAVSNGVSFGSGALAENVTIVRPSTFARPPEGSCGGFSFGSSQCKVRNCLVMNTPFSLNNTQVMGEVTNNISDGVISIASANSQQNVLAANVFIDPAADFRIKAGSPTINAGAAPSNTARRAPSGSRQMGAATDIGAWEYPEAIQAPSATITSVTVQGTTVTIQCTTSGTPTSGTVAIRHTATSYNDSAVDQGPVPLTLGAGTASATFTSMRVGEYTLDVKVGNDAYPSVNATNVADYTVNITDAVATSVVQDPMDGEVLHIHGTYSGNATSASILVPALTSDPQGALDTAGTVVLNNGSFTSDIDLQPGNYGAAVLRFTTANGTSLAQTGTSPVSIIGIYGMPQAEQGTPDTTPPVQGGGIVFSAITATGWTMGWTAATDDTGVARYEYSLDGTTYTAIGSALTYAVTGKTAATPYTVSLRAVDFGGNVSNVITGTVTTSDSPPVVVPPAPNSISILLVTDALAQAANLTALRWSWFDQATPNLFLAPTDRGTAESTDANGQLTIPLPNSTLPKGGIGWLVITNSTGNPALDLNAFSGPVAVE